MFNNKIYTKKFVVNLWQTEVYSWIYLYWQRASCKRCNCYVACNTNLHATKIPSRSSVRFNKGDACIVPCYGQVNSVKAATSSPCLCVHLKCTNCTAARRGRSLPPSPSRLLSSIPLCSEHSSWNALVEISISDSATSNRFTGISFTSCRWWIEFRSAT